MNKFSKFFLVTMITLAASPFTFSAEKQEDKSIVTPQTPQTSAFHQFLKAIANEEFDLQFKQSSTTDKRILTVNNPSNNDRFIGLFPQGTKTSEAIAFISSYLANPIDFIVIDEAEAKLTEEKDEGEKSAENMDSNKFSKIVSDKEKTTFLLASVQIPADKPQESAKPVIAATSQSDKFDQELKRFESWVQREARPALEQAGVSTGKALEKAGQQTGAALEKAGQQTASFSVKAANQIQNEGSKAVKRLFGKKI